MTSGAKSTALNVTDFIIDAHCPPEWLVGRKAPQSCKSIESDWTGVSVPAQPSRRESPQE